MKRFLRIALFTILGLAVLLAIAFPFLKAQTKKASPETTLHYTDNGYDVSIRYSQPAKKGRVVFGGLVPYGRTWRTGANEATEFETKTPLTIGDKTLAVGKYTLWTIPEKDNWTVIWNSKQYMWGINGKENGQDVASRDPQGDVLQVLVPVMAADSLRERFTMYIAPDSTQTPQLHLTWDNVEVRVPIKK
jgi:hypothetical protein